MSPPEGQGGALNLAVTPPAVILLAGLQGAGKTTTAGKTCAQAAHRAEEEGAAGALRRLPSGRDRTAETLAGQVTEVDFYAPEAAAGSNPVAIAQQAIDWARPRYYDVVIVDTAGRLAIDEAMMAEAAAISAAVKPAETLFVVTPCSARDAVNTAKAFNRTADADRCDSHQARR